MASDGPLRTDGPMASDAERGVLLRKKSQARAALIDGARTQVAVLLVQRFARGFVARRTKEKRAEASALERRLAKAEAVRRREREAEEAELRKAEAEARRQAWQQGIAGVGDAVSSRIQWVLGSMGGGSTPDDDEEAAIEAFYARGGGRDADDTALPPMSPGRINLRPTAEGRGGRRRARARRRRTPVALWCRQPAADRRDRDRRRRTRSGARAGAGACKAAEQPRGLPAEGLGVDGDGGGSVVGDAPLARRRPRGRRAPRARRGDGRRRQRRRRPRCEEAARRRRRRGRLDGGGGGAVDHYGVAPAAADREPAARGRRQFAARTPGGTPQRRQPQRLAPIAEPQRDPVARDLFARGRRRAPQLESDLRRRPTGSRRRRRGGAGAARADTAAATDRVALAPRAEGGQADMDGVRRAPHGLRRGRRRDGARREQCGRAKHAQSGRTRRPHPVADAREARAQPSGEPAAKDGRRRRASPRSTARGGTNWPSVASSVSWRWRRRRRACAAPTRRWRRRRRSRRSARGSTPSRRSPTAVPRGARCERCAGSSSCGGNAASSARWRRRRRAAARRPSGCSNGSRRIAS